MVLNYAPGASAAFASFILLQGGTSRPEAFLGAETSPRFIRKRVGVNKSWESRRTVTLARTHFLDDAGPYLIVGDFREGREVVEALLLALELGGVFAGQPAVHHYAELGEVGGTAVEK